MKGQVEVVLIDAVPNLGELGDVRTVRAGYYRNYLGPSGKARYATPKVLAELASTKTQIAQKREESRKKAIEVATRLRDLVLTFERPSRNGRLYGSIRPSELRKELEERGISIPAQGLNRNGRITQDGRHKVQVDLYPGIQEEIEVAVNPIMIADINVMEWVMASPEEQLRTIMKEEVGDKIESLSQDIRALTKLFNDFKTQNNLAHGRFQSDISSILDHLGIEPNVGPK